MYVIFSSYGNDSIALIQLAHEKGLDDVHVVYSDTGWAAPFWHERLTKAEAWVKYLGFTPHRLTSMGLEALVKDKKAWPRQGMQFCTHKLKIEPSIDWLEGNDPSKTAVCLVGVRRDESRERQRWNEFTPSSANHGGRTLWAPMVAFSEADRDAVLARAGWDVLPHRSMECFPCINANRKDLQMVTEDRIETIERIETEMGFTKAGKPRTMYRPYHYMGATGIREIIKWANSPRGKYNSTQPDLFDSLDDGTGKECESGFCGL